MIYVQLNYYYGALVSVGLLASILALFISAAKLYLIWSTIHLYLFGDTKSYQKLVLIVY
jgi:hypothetical protein